MIEKKKVISLINEYKNSNENTIKTHIVNELSNYRLCDYAKLSYSDKMFVHYLYDVLFFIKRCSNIGEFYTWFNAWSLSDAPCRYKISGKLKD